MREHARWEDIEGEGLQRREGVQGHAMVTVTGCEVGRMCEGMQGRRQGRGHTTVTAMAMVCEVRRVCEGM